MTLYDYFDRIAIIHLPSRRDRYHSLSTEFRRMGIDIQQPKVQIPHAPVPSDWSGWPSGSSFPGRVLALAPSNC